MSDIGKPRHFSVLRGTTRCHAWRQASSKKGISVRIDTGPAGAKNVAQRSTTKGACRTAYGQGFAAAFRGRKGAFTAAGGGGGSERFGADPGPAFPPEPLGNSRHFRSGFRACGEGRSTLGSGGKVVRNCGGVLSPGAGTGTDGGCQAGWDRAGSQGAFRAVGGDQGGSFEAGTIGSKLEFFPVTEQVARRSLGPKQSVVKHRQLQPVPARSAGIRLRLRYSVPLRTGHS